MAASSRHGRPCATVCSSALIHAMQLGMDVTPASAKTELEIDLEERAQMAFPLEQFFTLKCEGDGDAWTAVLYQPAPHYHIGWLGSGDNGWSALGDAVRQCLTATHPFEELCYQWDEHRRHMPLTPIPDPRVWELDYASNATIGRFRTMYLELICRWQSRWLGREHAAPLVRPSDYFRERDLVWARPV